ncbi:MAG: RNA polymerase sigma factor [Saprospiraceae bacterium]|nr:RNA polymerase sigma factor [Saprospiraceae bacterium]
MQAITGSSYSQLSDEKLIPLIAMNEQQAYTVLMRRYERLVQSVLSRYLSDPEAVKEVMQDTFLRAFRALPDFQGRSKFSTWLYKIAISLAINRLRVKRYMSWQALEDAPFSGNEDYADLSASFEKQETYGLLQNAIRRLNEQDAVALELFYLHEHSVEEIGQMTGWTSSNIKSRLSRARVRLRTVMEREGVLGMRNEG